MSETKPGIARDGTMQVTAKEGIDYLKAHGKDTLLKVQGLVEDKTSAQSQETNVSAVTEEGSLQDDKKSGEDASQNKDQQKDEKKEPTPEPQAKKTKLTKDSTMAATAKEGKALLAGEKLGDTRQDTTTQKNKKTPLKKNSTIAKTMEEAKFVLDGDVDVNSGRKTRSQSRGETTPRPPVKKARAVPNTAKEGKSKGKKGKAAPTTAVAAAADGDSEGKSDS